MNKMLQKVIMILSIFAFNACTSGDFNVGNVKNQLAVEAMNYKYPNRSITLNDCLEDMPVAGQLICKKKIALQEKITNGKYDSKCIAECAGMLEAEKQYKANI